MNKAREAVAFVFRRAGEAELSEEAFVRHVSLDLHWLSPTDARRFLEGARALGFLVPGGGGGRVRVAAELGRIEVPIDFRAGPELLEGLPAATTSPVVEALVEAAARARNRPLPEIWAEVARKQDDKLLEPSAAALLVAAAAGVDIKPFVPRVKEELARAARAAGASPSSS